MSMNKEVQQMDGEEVLHDVLHLICEYVNYKDLASMAQVSKSWKFAAKNEKKRRIRIQQFYLPYDMDDLDDRLYVNPMASLLVYDSKLEKSPLPLCFPGFRCDNRILAKEMLEKFQRQVPNKLIVLGVDEHVTTFVADHQELRPDTPTICNFEEASNPNILGVFFPSSKRRIRVHVAAHSRLPWPRDHSDRMESINRLAAQLGLYDLCDPYPKSTIIQIAMITGRDHTLIGELGRRAQENRKEITWTSIFGGKLAVEDTCSEDLRRPTWIGTAFVRISGPNVESWGSFIHLCSDRDQIQRKLEELNARVKRKRHNLGFFYAPSCGTEWCSHTNHPCGDSLEMVMSLNRVFPDIRFTGFFVNSNVYKRLETGRGRRIFQDRFDENDVRNFNKDFLYRLPYYVSIIVITYN